MKLRHATIIILLVLILDQWLKIYIKTHFALKDDVKIFDWFLIYFDENEGAAWGMSLPGEYGKLALTLFRIVAIGGIGYWLWDSIKKKAHTILIVAISLIFAGALGNVIDSVFYGVIFDDSNGKVATLFAEQPYGTLFHGKVVDMFYFPIFQTTIPEFIPFVGGKDFLFFNAIFNIADAAISIAVGLLIFFHKKAFPK